MSDKKKTYKEVNGTTRVGDFLRLLVKQGKKVAPELLDLSGKLTGIGALEELGNLIKGDTGLSDLDKQLLLAELEYDKAELQETTKRWQSDMGSDSWASKNIRPYSLVATLIFTFIIILLDSSIEKFSVKDHWVELLITILMIMIGAYYGGRTYEKTKKVAGKIFKN